MPPRPPGTYRPHSDLPLCIDSGDSCGSGGGGPVLIDGPVEVVLDDGRVVRSDRVVVALCLCRRSRIYPFCDTSHRRRVRDDRVAPVE